MEIKLDENNFEKEVLQSEIPVLVDFFATWCAPCKMMAPIIEEISNEYEGKIKVGIVDVDQSMKVAKENGIMSIPTFKLYKNGEVVASVTGAMNKAQLLEKIEI